ncbi:MAG: histidine kinase [Candidatus Borkfalkiaceae bacterium]|nr:histidine kinase [Christensenellaceae bacterium]
MSNISNLVYFPVVAIIGMVIRLSIYLIIGWWTIGILYVYIIGIGGLASVFFGALTIKKIGYCRKTDICTKILLEVFFLSLFFPCLYVNKFVQTQMYDVLLCVCCILVYNLFYLYPEEVLGHSLSTVCISVLCGVIVKESKVIFFTNTSNLLFSSFFGVFIGYRRIMDRVGKIRGEINRENKYRENVKNILASGQMRPHFIFNSLATIRVLCAEDSAKAQDAIDDFMEYLRGNIDTLSLSNLSSMPFDKVLQTVKHYVNLEKIRYGDKLNVIYDIKEENFFMPALCLQPIVENAVKHGLGDKEGGGTVTVSTFKKDDLIYLVVKDDGIGFEQESGNYIEGEGHIGIANSRYLLKQYCNANMNIISEKGQGTSVIIEFPQA